MENYRKLVVKALVTFEKEKSYSNLALDGLLSKVEASMRPFCAMLFYGVIERKLTLDYIISLYSKLSLKRISSVVLNILRTALYQIRYMDSVTDYAAVNEAVALCKEMKSGYSSGFVNAVLRNAVRNFKGIKNSLKGKDEKRLLELEYSIPGELIERWEEDYGKQAAMAMLQESLGVPPLTLRVNTAKSTTAQAISSLKGQGLKAEEVILRGFEKQQPILTTSGAIAATEAYKKGLIYAQDLSSQLCAMAAAYYADQADTGKPIILDLCAAPGSKSFTIHNSLKKESDIYAFDINPSRVNLIRQGVKRLGLKIKCNPADASVYNKNIPDADVILCDLPCSGLGVIRRKPEIKYKNLNEIQGLPALQLKILNNAAGYLKENGILIYSTCTLLKAENEDVVNEFLRQNENFSPAEFPEFITRTFKGQKNPDGQMTIFPGRSISENTQNDGFFIAAFCKDMPSKGKCTT